MAIVSNIAEVDTETLESAEEQAGSVTNIIQTFEKQIKSIPVTSDTELTFKQPKVAVKVRTELCRNKDDTIREEEKGTLTLIREVTE